MRDKTVRRAYKTVRLAVQILNKIYRLSTDFNATKPRLNDIRTSGKYGTLSIALMAGG